MAWEGYYELGGVEIINVARTEAYARNAKLSWFKPTYNNAALPFMLGDGLEYRTPLLDNAPWVDPEVEESLDFYGLFPLSVEGIEDSTRSATVVESTRDGGNVALLRHGTKTVVFSGVIIAASDLSAEYGMRWLRRALIGPPCTYGRPTSTRGNGGADLRYFSGEPDMVLPVFGGMYAVLSGGPAESVNYYRPIVSGGRPNEVYSYIVNGGGPSDNMADVIYKSEGPFVITPPDDTEAEECLREYRRTLRKFTVNGGPTVMSKKTLTDGSCVWTVQFTGVAGTPWEFSEPQPIIEGFMNPSVTDPFYPGVEGGTYDDFGYIHEDQPCEIPIWQPVYDPLCSALIPPPAPPDITLGCFEAPDNWFRRQITIPPQYISTWGEMVPVVRVQSPDVETRNLRLRFYADVNNSGNPDDEACSYIGDVVMSYIPLSSTLVFDGVTETVTVIGNDGSVRRADSLVFNTEGKPFDWPALSCGYGYIVTFDLPQTQQPPIVDLSLVARAV